MSSFKLVEANPGCTCADLPPIKENRPLSRALIVVVHEKAFVLDCCGPDVEYALQELGHEFWDGYDDGVWYWEGYLKSYINYWGEHDLELEGETFPVDEERWKHFVETEDALLGPLSDYYEEKPPCPVHSSASEEAYGVKYGERVQPTKVPEDFLHAVAQAGGRDSLIEATRKQSSKSDQTKKESDEGN